MTDTDFFAVQPEQRTLYQENVCRPGWVQPMPEPPADPLYIPNAEPTCSCSPDELCETCWRERRDWFEGRATHRRASMNAHAKWFESIAEELSNHAVDAADVDLEHLLW
jgi:hypothetical protein